MSEVSTRCSTAAIATASRTISRKEATFRQSRPPKVAEATASAIARPATIAARRTTIGCACELVRATIEVALVLSVSSTAAQPLLLSTEART